MVDLFPPLSTSSPYRLLDEEQLPKTILRIKAPDQDALASLLLDAFLGPDADHEQNQAMAQQDIQAYFAGNRHPPLLEYSWGAWEGDKFVVPV